MAEIKYAKIENGEVIKYPYSVQDLRTDNPNVSFSSIIDEPTKSRYSMLPIQKVETQINYTKNISENIPELIEGVWTQSWSITDATQQEIDQRLSKKWQEVREERGGRLNSSDWTQLPDSPLTEEQKNAWRQYRQELRDITNQANPFEIIYPVQPS
jgi:predicted house-cleaning noncanonical NTP pyrophosphatase (MazG superfamily)